ncbi:C40 family peptidase [Flammeovirga aprica]|uniref:C40 family peptidase n=1 Tax=Flammeovirga aprica JL-4 TaxID=694437 RepID=A0A7X9S097_9BACT|nr:C40 family peptidase [Flammeovirga aprica]NME71859.1 C40 family peptidase [Flammeovirga aprica JL-4]
MKHTQYTLLTLLLFSFAFQSCEFGKQYTYGTRQDRLDKVKQKQLSQLGVSQSSSTASAATQNTNAQNATAVAAEITTKTLKAEGKAKIAIKTAWSFEGVKYATGGTTKKGMDCSGLMLVSWQAANVQLPRVSSEQAKRGKAVSFNNLQPGDLVFFHPHGGTRINHVGMVTEVEGGKMYFIHASTSRGVMESELTSAYWKGIFSKARRLH